MAKSNEAVQPEETTIEEKIQTARKRTLRSLHYVMFVSGFVVVFAFLGIAYPIDLYTLPGFLYLISFFLELAFLCIEIHLYVASSMYHRELLAEKNS